MTNKIIGVLCALDQEFATFKTILKNPTTEQIHNYNFYIGDLNNNKVVVVKCGIGKVNAGIITMLLITNFHPDLIFNSGIAGGFNRDLKTLDTVVATGLLYSDVDFLGDTGVSLRYGQLQDFPLVFPVNFDVVEKIKETFTDLKFGYIMTGDQFVTNYEKTKELVDKYFNDLPILACDMESASVAHVCYLEKIPCVVIRTISDKIGANNVIDYYKLCNEASMLSAKLVSLIVEKL